MAVDLDALDYAETAFAHSFLDHLVRYRSVCWDDFPHMDEARFYELAEAIMSEMNKQEMH
jgi:hypothetical protein